MSCEPACDACAALRSSALQLVGESGIEGLSERSLSTRAQLSPAELRRHYPTASECLYETYEEVSCSLLLDLADAFGHGADWDARVESVGHRLLARIVARPAEARLVFIEAMRDRALRERRALNRRWMIEYLTRRHADSDDGERLAMQFELMIGAGFQLIASVLATGNADDLAGLEPRLARLGESLTPTGA